MPEQIILSIALDDPEGAPEPDLRGAVAAVTASGGIWCGVDDGVALARFEPDDPSSALAGALHALEALDAVAELSGGSRGKGALCLGRVVDVAESGDPDDIGPGVVLGEAIDRARALRRKVRPGELLLDRRMKDAVDAEVIVARSI